MKTGLLRAVFWALDDAGARAEKLAAVSQNENGTFDAVWTTDPRPVERVLELRDGDDWREVRREVRPGGGARMLV